MIMKLYAICLIKNEDDIIAQTLKYATRYCDKIFVIDNGSTDRTWELVNGLSKQFPQIVPFVQTQAPYDDGLRWMAYDAHHQGMSDTDWWLVLDSDEFLAEDPRPVIQQAMDEGADIVVAWQIQFYFTERDLADWETGKDARDRSIFERRRYYRIDHQEPRLFRNRSAGTWEASPLSRKLGMPPWFRGKTGQGTQERCMPTHAGKISRRRILNRHYQYRDPEQIAKRLKLRYGQSSFAAQVPSMDWRSKLRAARYLDHHKDGEPWRFRIVGLASCYSGRVRYAIHSRLRRTRRRLTALLWSEKRQRSREL
jgi:glycosyltransferase involved in cell wall biosynthesis